MAQCHSETMSSNMLLQQPPLFWQDPLQEHQWGQSPSSVGPGWGQGSEQATSFVSALQTLRQSLFETWICFNVICYPQGLFRLRHKKYGQGVAKTIIWSNLVEVWKTIWHATPYVHILGQVKSSHGLRRVELQVPSQATPKVLTLGTGTMTMIWFDPWTIR